MKTKKRHEKGLPMLDIGSNPAYSDAIELFEQVCDGYRRFHILKAALDLDLFAWLAEFGPASPTRIANVMALDERYVGPFLQALTEEGFLKQNGSKLTLSDVAAKLQAPGAPVKPAQILARVGGVSARWGHLTAMLHGRVEAAIGLGNNEGESTVCPGDYYHVERAVRQWGDFRHAQWLLDLGGTGGGLCIALCKENPGLHASILVRADEIDEVSKKVADAKLAERIELITDDLFSVQFEHEYDIVLVVHSLYAYPKRVLEAMEKVAEVTRSFGLLVTQHWFDDEQGTPAENPLRELDQRLHQSRKPLRHAEAFADRVTSAGFSWLKGQNLPAAKQGLQLRLALHCDESAQPGQAGIVASVRRAASSAKMAIPAL
jgi:hypothetical protein